MSEKLPDGWESTGKWWSTSNGAMTMIGGFTGGPFVVTFHGPRRATKEEAEQDRLNLIVGLEGGADLIKAREQIDTLTARLDRAAERHDAIVECLDAIRAPQEATIPERIYAWRNGVQAIITAADRERDAALKELATLKSRRAGDHAEHLATLNEISKALNAYPTIEGVTAHYGPHEIAGAVRAQGKTLHETRTDRQNLSDEIAMLKDERERMADEMTSLEDFRDAANARIADVERQLEEKSTLHRSALTLVQRLRAERSGLRDIIATLEHQIDGLKAAACDTVPQLLRDSMRVTQEESARIKADMARKDAEIASLRQRVAASEAYAQHLLAALNLRTLP